MGLTLGRIRIDTRRGIAPGKWKIFLGGHGISHVVAGVSIVAAPNMPLPMVSLTLLGQVELPPELVALVAATLQPPAEEASDLSVDKEELALVLEETPA